MKRRIYIALSGGIGNQLFQCSKAIDISRDDPEIDVKLVWPTLARTSAWERPRLQEWLGDRFKVGSVPLREVLHAVQRKISLGRGWVSTHSDQWWFDSKEEFDPRRVVSRSSIWVRSLFHRKPSAWTQQQMRTFYHETKTRRGIPPIASAYAVLHIRLGDYMTERAAAHGIQPLAHGYYRALFNRLRQRSDQIFVVTNGTAEQIESILGKARAGAYRIVDGQNDYQDFSVMAGADHIGTANSTFSLWAAYLSNAKSVLAPDRWLDPRLKTGRNVNSLYPPEWEVLGEDENA